MIPVTVTVEGVGTGATTRTDLYNRVHIPREDGAQVDQLARHIQLFLGHGCSCSQDLHTTSNEKGCRSRGTHTDGAL